MNGTLFYTQRMGSRNTSDPEGWKYNHVLIEKYYNSIKLPIDKQYNFF
jgi:hypothetical protein